MKQKKLKITNELLELLSDAEFSEFTLLDLRDSFELRYGLGNYTNSSELRKWIYRRILPLVKKGYLIKADLGSDQAALYQITDQFKQHFQIRQNTGESNASTALMTGTTDSPQIGTLRSKLNQYQVDMLACAGECKEYQQLAADFPHLREQIEPMFRSARERSSELMGHFRAINNLLKQTGLSE